MTYTQPQNVGFYAVARQDGRTIAADGPHPAGRAHELAESLIRPAVATVPFVEVGVLRVQVSPGATLPSVTATCSHERHLHLVPARSN